MKKILSILLTFIILISVPLNVFASEGIKFRAIMCTSYDPDKCINNKFEFMPMSNFEYQNHSYTEDSKIIAVVESIQKERRWHKSGFVALKVLGVEENGAYCDLSDSNIKAIVRKYDKINKKDAAKTGAELTATTAASFIIPGIDIVYYFTKGTIKNDNGDTRFKSGVHTAYENSICWFFLKGKPIALNRNDTVTVLFYINAPVLNEDLMEER